MTLLTSPRVPSRLALAPHASRRRPKWVYSRSRSRTDVSPLLAVAAALWLASLELAVETRELH